jgi:hypothetical protein
MWILNNFMRADAIMIINTIDFRMVLLHRVEFAE